MRNWGRASSRLRSFRDTFGCMRRGEEEYKLGDRGEVCKLGEEGGRGNEEKGLMNREG